MEEKVYRIYKEYSDNNEILTKDALREIFEYFRSEFALDDFCKKLEFDDTIDEKYEGGHYTPQDLTVTHRYNKILKESSNLTVDVKNLFLVEILLHELNHGLHYKDNYEKALNAELGIKASGDLLDYCKDTLLSYNYDIDYSNPKYKDAYNANYSSFTSERLCEIDSFEYLKKLIYKYENNEERKWRLIDLVDLELYYWYLNGYEVKDNKVISPVSKFSDSFRLKRKFWFLNIVNKVLLKDEENNTKELFKLGLTVKPSSVDAYNEYFGKVFYDYRNKVENGKNLIKKK